MRIALMSTFPPEKCGVGIYAENLRAALRRQKGSQIVSVGTPGSNADIHLDFASLRLASRLKEIVRKYAIDAIHIQYNAPHFGRFTLNAGLMKALRESKIPIVVTLHEVQYPEKEHGLQKIRKAILRRIEKRIVRLASGIIVHTEGQRDFLKKRYHSRKVKCIYHGLTLRTHKRKKDNNLLFFGILTPAKGVHVLINAMEFLPEYTLSIAGSAPRNMKKYERTLQDLCRDKKNVKAQFGWISEEEKSRLLADSDIMVLPYSWAPYQSGVLHDAASEGIPVVVSRVGALHEMVKKYAFGEVMSQLKPKAIAMAVKAVAAKYGRCQKNLRAYRKKANWDAVARQHLMFYGKVAKK